MKTLLLGGSTKKIKCRWEGVSGRRSENFITGKKQKKIQVPVGRGGEWTE